jgi:hypothetical protein
VPDGQVFFARLVTNRSTVYVIQLGKWRAYEHSGGNNGRIRVRYVVVTNQPPNSALEPTAAPLLRFVAASRFLSASCRRESLSGGCGSAWIR